MMNINQINDWIVDAKAGDEAVYYTGELAKERERIKEAEEVANYVWKMMEKNLISLVQRKGERLSYYYHEYHYTMQRTANDRI